MKKKIIIGTRGSKLALWQAEWIKSELQKINPDLEIALNKIKTTGDKILDVPLAKVGGKGLFVKEIEDALLRGDIDLAVHSIKDVPTDLPEGLRLAVICKREDPRDALIISQKSIVNSQQSLVKTNDQCPVTSDQSINSSLVTRHSLLYDLPKGACIGTSSLRRSCQLFNIRPDLKIKQLRGNLDTRLKKLDEGQFDAIIVAVAGIKRLGWAERITEILRPEICLPAIGQGAIGIECRTDDEFVNNIVTQLDHKETSICVRAERAFLKQLEGGCQVPIAAYARIVSQDSPPHPSLGKGGHRGGVNNSSFITPNSKLIMDGLVGNITGDRIIKGHIEGSPEHAEYLGISLAEDILSRGAKEILEKVYRVS
jgi:hydroxymethylbilane synthase